MTLFFLLLTYIASSGTANLMPTLLKVGNKISSWIAAFQAAF